MEMVHPAFIEFICSSTHQDNRNLACC